MARLEDNEDNFERSGKNIAIAEIIGVFFGFLAGAIIGLVIGAVFGGLLGALLGAGAGIVIGSILGYLIPALSTSAPPPRVRESEHKATGEEGSYASKMSTLLRAPIASSEAVAELPGPEKFNLRRSIASSPELDSTTEIHNSKTMS